MRLCCSTAWYGERDSTQESSTGTRSRTHTFIMIFLFETLLQGESLIYRGREGGGGGKRGRREGEEAGGGGGREGGKRGRREEGDEAGGG
ncbi:hypothetical protein CesoFtcFv8_009613 [Champsocephalus esox]|uniref:Uncharacterized protein n=1 Tax=Champsocephalus esox TaxID=159716 RepID=A0AAN8GZA6_9TELE|nr:hypothetical protein CesoFtcFv8_009613 [Champsocephalus esox]